MQQRRRSSQYHIGHEEPNDATIRVTLKQIRPSKRHHIDSVSSQSLHASIKWQQKIDGPLDIAKKRSFQKSYSDHLEDATRCDPSQHIGEIGYGEYNKQFIQRLEAQSSVSKFCTVKQAIEESSVNPNTPGDTMQIYTYVDGDYYIPDHDASPHTSSKYQTPNSLSCATKALSAHNLHSKETLGDSAAALHDRISRDQRHKVMHIMAAVDCEPDQ